MTVFVAVTSVRARTRGIGPVLVLAGMLTVGLMIWINFTIDSDYKWELVGPALLWLVGVVAYILERKDCALSVMRLRVGHRPDARVILSRVHKK